MQHLLPKKWVFSFMHKNLFFLCLLLAPSFSFAQQSCSISISCKEKALQEVLQQLREQCDVVFSYNPESIPLTQKISLQLSDKSLDFVLDQLSEHYGLGYQLRGNRVILFKDSKRKQLILSGFVKDAESGEKLIAARVVDLRSGRGVLTNEYGFFSLKLPCDSISLWVTYATYKNLRKSFPLEKNAFLQLELNPDYELGEVEILADEARIWEGDYDPSEVWVSIREVKALPALLGEVDVMKTLQLMPGVQAGREGSSGLYIRGGGPDQNLVLLDGVPLYYVNHLGGFFSIFNPDALTDVKLIKGGFPSRYGGRLSSVLDVHMKEGNMKEWHGAGSLGLLTGKFSLEGPLKKEKSSFIISARRSYLDLILSPIVSRITDRSVGLGYAFYDLNAKINYLLSPNDRFYVSFYSGHDRTFTSFKSETQNVQPGLKEFWERKTSSLVQWGNNLMAARWNHIWSPRLFSNMTATYGYYEYKLQFNHNYTYHEELSGRRSFANYQWRYQSGIQDIGLKLDFDFYPHPLHEVKFGGGSLSHSFRPGYGRINFYSDFDRFINSQAVSDSSLIRSLENHVYVEDQWKISPKFRLHTGLHAVYYVVGKKSYPSLQPRISAFYRPAKNLQFKAAFVSMAQYVHLLTNPGLDLPSDRWVPATEKIPPQTAQQLSLGAWWERPDKGWSMSVEGYYKKLQNLIAYSSSENFYSQSIQWQDFVEKDGTGEAYGLECLLRKIHGKTSGWIGYTLSWNYRQFDHINGGRPFPFRYDRRHDISAAIVHDFSEKVSFSANWVYGTGNAYTLTTGRHQSWMQDIGEFSPFSLEGFAGVFAGERNGNRMRNYHRLDLGFQFKKQTNWGERSWHLGLYNAYNRKNPYYYFFETELISDNGGPLLPLVKLKQFSLFSMLPSISYHFSF